MNESEFWENVNQSDANECWLWTRGKTPHGYGRLWYRSDYAYAHRVAFELTKGPIPKGLHVCHHCDNPPCVNPAHLFLGTAQDNAVDRQAKGRGGGWALRGIRPKNTKLTPQGVIEIRRLRGKVKLRELAERFDVSISTIHHIQTGRSWKTIEPEARS